MLKGITILGALALAAGCASVETDFALPQGDSEAGRAAFIALGCPSCHSATDAPRAENSDTGVFVRLGGTVSREKSYIELVTAVINPSHRISSGGFGRTTEVVDGKRVSRMRVFNDVMTVTQLADIIAYLAPQYRIAMTPVYEYPEYEYDGYYRH